MATRWRLRLVALLLLGAGNVAGAPAASPPPPPAALQAASAEVGAPDSPRASVARFLALCQEGKYTEALRYLDVPNEMRDRAEDFARRLEQMLRADEPDLARLSPLSSGDPNDGLPPDVDAIATRSGRLVTAGVRLIKVADPQGARWVFSSTTVALINQWYARMEDHWLARHLPEALLRPGPKGILWWQWVALPVLAIVSLVLAVFLARFTRTALGAVTRRTATAWDDAVLKRLRGPLIALWALGLMFLGAHWLDLHPMAEAWWMRLLRGALLVVLFWTLLRAIEGVAEALAPSARAHGRAVALTLLPIGVRVAKIAVVLMALIALLSEFGYPVASLLAGLGLGGLAIALAAQKTLEHVIGSVAISIDQPFRPGDRIKVDDLVGTVESIGLRSTRIRTADRTLVTVPNGRLADLRIENIAARDRLRVNALISLPLDVPPEAVREVLRELREAVSAAPRISHEDVRVALKEIKGTTIDIEVTAWFETTDESELRELRDDLLLQLHAIAARAKQPAPHV